MATYNVHVEWSGYSRGIATYSIEAESEAEASELYREGLIVLESTVRDDRTDEITSVDIIEEL